MTRAVVSLLAMGGTIANAPSAGRATPRHGAAELAGLLRALPVELRTGDVRTVSSRAVTPADMWALAEAVRREIAGGANGVVITHGTDTLEETAYALALLVDTPVPVVLTGAMRAPHLPGADGQANLVAAVAAALHEPLARYGPVVVFQDEIHVARLVTKQHSARVAAFASPSAGPVGFVIENEVELLLGPAPEPDRLTAAAPPDRKVELVVAVAGSDGTLVDAIAGDVAGLVVAGTGGGHLSPALAEAVLRVVRSGRPVVLTSRCADGPILRRTYGGPGSETHLLGEGVLAARILSPAKARLRLLFGLSAGLPAEDLFPPRTYPTTPPGGEGADRDRNA
ncbi:asparaginase [Nonomuraea zeae]|uniref:Asparaginase n=1 Tax=Nonomuraea zeae TaxID=1642303 RepID=A0A5S4GL01_9ACTN|nr:asparaginase [Nonomuraea zeae]TMR33646.1 asparaginase [Nonomuraea zeae]